MRTPGRRKVFVIGARRHSGGFRLRSDVAAVVPAFIFPGANPANSFAPPAALWQLKRCGLDLPTP